MAAVIASILTLILTVTEVIPAEPWEAVAITVGGVAAICSLVVTMIEAAFEPNEIDAPRG